MSNRPRMEPNDGPRRLKEIVRGNPQWFESKRAAERHWKDLCDKILQYSVEDAKATIVVDFVEEEKGWAIRGIIHPARIQYRMALEYRGVMIEVGEKGDHWHRLSAKSSAELLEEFQKPNRGRTWI